MAFLSDVLVELDHRLANRLLTGRTMDEKREAALQEGQKLKKAWGKARDLLRATHYSGNSRCPEIQLLKQVLKRKGSEYFSPTSTSSCDTPEMKAHRFASGSPLSELSATELGLPPSSAASSSTAPGVWAHP